MATNVCVWMAMTRTVECSQLPRQFIAKDEAKEGRLAGPTRTREKDKFSLLDVERDVREGDNILRIDFGDMKHLNHHVSPALRGPAFAGG